MANIIINIEKINIYLLPLATFFILISTAATNFFLILTVFSAFILCIKNNSLDEIYKNDFLFKICFLIFFLFIISSFYTIADSNEVFDTLKKYIKIIYIPFIYFYLKKYKNEKLILKYFLVGATLVLLLSYIKYFNLINFENFYKAVGFLNFSGLSTNIVETKTTVFQNYIIQGIVLSFYSFLCIYIGLKNNKYYLHFFSMLAFINVIFMNDSRTAYIIIFFLFLFLFYKIITNVKIRLIFFSLVILLVISNFSNNFIQRINALNNDVKLIQNDNFNSSLGMRYVWLNIGLENLINEPIIGNGTGSFYKSAENYFKKNNFTSFGVDANTGRSLNVSSENLITNNPHSEFISISSQLGILGLLSFSIFLYLLFANNNGPMSFATFIIVFISSVFNSVFYDNMIGLFLVILISLTYKVKLK